MALVVELGCHALSRTDRIEAVLTPWHHAGEHRALQQSLRVDHRIVAVDLHDLSPGGKLAPGFGAQQRSAPTAHRHRHHAVDSRVHPYQSAVRLLDHPVDGSLWKPLQNVRHGRQVVDHVAQRGCLHEQNFFHGGHRPSELKSRP